MTNHWYDWDENKNTLIPRLSDFLSRREQQEPYDDKLDDQLDTRSPRHGSSQSQETQNKSSSSPSLSSSHSSSHLAPISSQPKMTPREIRLRIVELVDICKRSKGQNNPPLAFNSISASSPSPWTSTSSPSPSRALNSSGSSRSLQAGAVVAAVGANPLAPISSSSTASISPLAPPQFSSQIPLLPSILPKTCPAPLRKIHPEEVARQITLIQWHVFASLNLSKVLPGPHDIIVTVDTASGGPIQSSGPTSATSTTSSSSLASPTSSSWAPFAEWNALNGHLSRWAATCIATLPKMAVRVKTLQFLIEVAYFCHKMGNWEACQSLLEGLKMLPLPQTWAALPTKVKSLHEMLTVAFKSLNANELLHTYHASPYSALVSARIQSRRQNTLPSEGVSPRTVSVPGGTSAVPSIQIPPSGHSSPSAPGSNTPTSSLHIGHSLTHAQAITISSTPGQSSSPVPTLSTASSTASSSPPTSTFSSSATAPPHIPVIDSFVQSLFHINKQHSRFLPQPHKRWLSKNVPMDEATSPRGNGDVESAHGEFASLASPSTILHGASSLNSTAASPLASSSKEHLFSAATGASLPTSPSSKIPVLNPSRAKAEALIISLLQTFQKTPFPFCPVPWIADLISKANPLSVWTIQEYCETLEPPKYAGPSSSSGSSSSSRKQSSPKLISSSGLRSPPKHLGSPIGSPGHSRPASPSSSPPTRECSPLEYSGLGISSLSSSPSSSWVEISVGSPEAHSPVSSGSPASSNSSPSTPALTPRSSASSLFASSSSHPNFNLRSPINRDPFAAELELEKFGFYLFNTPPNNESSSPTLSSSQTSQSNANNPSWWALLDQDRIEDPQDEMFAKFLLEFLPYPSLESHFSLSPMKSLFLNMKNSKLTRQFKNAARMRWRKDFCFAAPTHSKGLRLNSYRIVNNDMVQYVPSTSTVTLTNSSSAQLDFEFCKDTPVANSPSFTKSQIFLSFSPSYGTIAPGKSAVVKITTTLLEEVQFFKFVKIQAYWPDMQYSSFVPLLLVQTGTRTTAPIGVGPMGTKDEMNFNEVTLSNFRGFDSSQSTPSTTPTPSPRDNTFQGGGYAVSMSGVGPGTQGSSHSSSSSGHLPAPSSLLTDGYWKISMDDLKVLKRLGGSQAAVSLCLLHGVEVVLKKWDIGSLDAMPQDFLGELEALRMLRHPNLVQFLGASNSARGLAFIVTEFAAKGCLSDVLQRGDLNKSIKRKRRTQRTPHDASTDTKPTGNASPPALVTPLGASASPYGDSGFNPTVSSDTIGGADVHKSSSTSSLGSSSPHITVSTSVSASSFRYKMSLAVDIAKGMAYMHYRRRIHRDLKSLNVLVDENYSAKIADLGSSKHWATTTQMTTGVGTFDWIAPEVLKSKTYSFPADVFSFGLILWELVHEVFPNRSMEQIVVGNIPDVDALKLAEMFGFSHGHLLSSAGSGGSQLHSVVNGDIIGNPLAMEYVALIQHCCDPEASKRPNFSEIVVTLEQVYTGGLAIYSQISSSSSSVVVNLSSSSLGASSSSNQSVSAQHFASSMASLSNNMPMMMMQAAMTSPSVLSSPTMAPAPWSPGNFASSSTAATATSNTAGNASQAQSQSQQRSGSKDAWVRAMKSTSSNAALYYQHPPRSPVSSPSTGSPLTPPNQQSLISLGSFDDFSVDDYMTPAVGADSRDSNQSSSSSNTFLSSPSAYSPLQDSSSTDMYHTRLRGLGPNKRTGRIASSATAPTTSGGGVPNTPTATPNNPAISSGGPNGGGGGRGNSGSVAGGGPNSEFVSW